MKGDGPGQPVRWAAGPRSSLEHVGHCKMVKRMKWSMKKASRMEMEDQVFQPLRR